MANTKSAQKAVRSSQRKYERNRPIKSSVRTAVTKARRLLASHDDSAAQAVQDAMRSLDKAAQKGVIHANNAARKKSRLMKRLNAAASA